MRSTAINIVFLGFLLNFSTAQNSAQGSQNPLTVPACETMLSIVESCEYKLTAANTVTASIFNCLCFDNSGNYVPTVYDNAVAGCSSEFADQSTDFNFWLPGFCTDTEYATDTAVASSITAGGSPTLIELTGTPTVTSTGGVALSSSSTASTSTTASPGGLIGTTTSSSTLITPAPSSSTSSGTRVVASVSTTTSKAEGMKIAYNPRGGSFLSIFGSILGAIFLL